MWWCCDLPLKTRALALAKTTKFAEKRDAATLGGPEPASAATAPPTLLAWLQKRLVLLTRNPPLKPDRAWRQIPGPKLTPSQLHCGLVGAKEAVAEAHQKNRPHWRKYNAKGLISTSPPSINIVGGYKFPNAPDVQLREEKKSSFSLTAVSKPNANLDIPYFLKR